MTSPSRYHDQGVTVPWVRKDEPVRSGLSRGAIPWSPPSCHQAPPVWSRRFARIRRVRSRVVAILVILGLFASPIAGQDASTALGATAERVLDANTVGVVAVWRALSIGRVGGTPLMLRVRADLSVGAEPETDAGRRVRTKATASLSVPLSSGDSRVRFSLFGGLGYAMHKLSNIAPEEAVPDLARIEHTFRGIVTEVGMDIDYHLEGRIGLWASIALMRQRLSVGPSTVPQVSIGLSFR